MPKEDSDQPAHLNFRWAHKSKDTFSDVAAHMTMMAHYLCTFGISQATDLVELPSTNIIMI